PGPAWPRPGAGPARAGPLPGQAGGSAQRPQGPGPRRARQAGRAGPMSDLFGVAGSRLLDELHLGRAYRLRVASLRRLLVLYDQEITMLGREISSALAGDVGYLAIQAIPGVAPVEGAR